MKKLFIFDLDGTLLTGDKKITEESKKAIWKCKNER
jgi:hydroxymethylpyrimidine pyrophosphatase-like HAD family hydrolase